MFIAASPKTRADAACTVAHCQAFSKMSCCYRCAV